MDEASGGDNPADQPVSVAEFSADGGAGDIGAPTQFVQFEAQEGATGMDDSAGTTTAVYVTTTDGDPNTSIGASNIYMGEDGEHYVTLVQDGQTYAIPAADYQAMQAGGATLTIQTTPTTTAESALVQEATPGQDLIFSPQPATTQSFVGAKLESPIKSPGQQSVKWMGGQTRPQTTIKMPQPANRPIGVLQKSQPLRSFKPIRVDNWGIFLLSRLQHYFQKKEYCDLTIRFPTKNAQIKVHRLVVNACTDYFTNMERDGQLFDGAIDMPSNFTPEAVAPIIRFMYTGRLDLKEGMFQKLHDTATSLNMTVLTKLMDAQLRMDPEELKKAARKRRKTEDPVRQMRKIKRIEKKFTEEEKKAKIQSKLDAKSPVGEAAPGIMPGKKLPIWKRRSNMPEPVVSPPKQPPHQPDPTTLIPIDGPPSINVNTPPVSQVLIKEEMDVTSSAAPKAYGKGKVLDKPRVPAKVREMQQTLLFEKVRRTGMKGGEDDQNAKDMSVEEIKEFMAEQRKRLEDMGEDFDDDYYDNDADLDYGDDPEDGIDQPEDQMTTEPSLPSPAKPILKMKQEHNKDLNPEEILPDPTPRKSVRFSLRPGSIQTPKGIDGGEDDDIAEKDVENVTPPKKRGRSPTNQKDSEDSLDLAVEEFSRAAEEEEESSTTDDVNVRRSSRLPAPKQQDPDFVNTPESPTSKKRGRRPKEDESPPAKRTKTETPVVARKSSAPPPQVSPGAATQATVNIVGGTGGVVDQAQMVSEVLKKYPNLFKDGKPIKLKVMTKDAEGKSSMQYITLKAQNQPTTEMEGGQGEIATSSVTRFPQGEALGLRDIPKVMYTGRRGRPKVIRPGEYDPHAKERKEIQDRLSKGLGFSKRLVAGETFTTLDQVSASKGLEGTVIHQQLDPSSEAESFSTVASGIAASLGLVAVDHSTSSDTSQQVAEFSGSIEHEASRGQQAVFVSGQGAGTTVIAQGPLADLEHFEGQQIMVNYGPGDLGSAESFIVATSDGTTTQPVQIVQRASTGGGQPVQIVQASADGTILVSESAVIGPKATIEDAMAKLHGEGAVGGVQGEPQKEDKDTKVVMSQLAMDWDDDEEDNAGT